MPLISKSRKFFLTAECGVSNVHCKTAIHDLQLCEHHFFFNVETKKKKITQYHRRIWSVLSVYAFLGSLHLLVIWRKRLLHLVQYFDLVFLPSLLHSSCHLNCYTTTMTFDLAAVDDNEKWDVVRSALIGQKKGKDLNVTVYDSEYQYEIFRY